MFSKRRKAAGGNAIDGRDDGVRRRSDRRHYAAPATLEFHDAQAGVLELARHAVDDAFRDVHLRLRHIAGGTGLIIKVIADEELELLDEFRRYGPSTIRKRRSELYQAGHITSDGARKNKRGQKMLTWRTSAATPVDERDSFTPADYRRATEGE